MSTPHLVCSARLPLEQLVDYGSGELSAAEAEALEQHLFACDVCARRLDTLQRLEAALRGAFAAGLGTVAASQALLERLEGGGYRVREYRLPAGGRVACTAMPEDDFIAVRLAGGFAGREDVTLAVDFHDLSTDQHLRREISAVPFDHQAGEVILLFPGEVVRAYPRSVWTLEVAGVPGTYTMDHTPWQQLGGLQ